jgi:hypothetical protein
VEYELSLNWIMEAVIHDALVVVGRELFVWQSEKHMYLLS